MPPIEIRRLGLVDYDEGLRLQQELVDARKRNAVGDTLLLLEHPHVITLGSRTRSGPHHIVATAEELAARKVEVRETPRGGDVTYHGPGQLVAYPILDLKPDRCDVHRYVRDLEDVLMQVGHEFGVAATRVPGLTGVWVGDDKLAAIGVRLSRWVTSHGVALNVSTNLSYFDLIVPCGLVGRGVTSLERLLGRPVSMAEAEAAFTTAWSRVFSQARASTAVRLT